MFKTNILEKLKGKNTNTIEKMMIGKYDKSKKASEFLKSLTLDEKIVLLRNSIKARLEDMNFELEDTDNAYILPLLDSDKTPPLED